MTSAVFHQAEERTNGGQYLSFSWRLTVRRLLAGVASMVPRVPRPLRWLLSPVSIVCEGISVGILRAADVEQMVTQTYAGQPQFYDPRKYRLPHEQRLLPELLPLAEPGSRLLDAFCGQGREAELFSRNGYVVTGIDQLDWMIDAAREFARESNFDAEYITADFNSYRTEQPFDVVYTSCWMYSTCQSAGRRMSFLRKCLELCSKDGVIVLSYVSENADSRAATWLRFICARTAALLTFGNRKTERGERIYSGLFWHHLPELVVEQELQAANLATIIVIPAEGTQPTFRILQPGAGAEM